MNMLRVWGGGIYEDELFYDLCDEHGIMIWQDFMFACAAYPTDEAFLAEAAAEVRHQVRRLHNHPSIVLWCGDNENEWAATNWWHQDAGDPPLRPGYDRLIAETVAPIVAEEDPERSWWPSSPSSGGDGAPNDLTRGDTHYWEVWHGDRPIGHYREVAPRFCSEFGFQSLPSLATLARALGHDVRELDSAAMRHRQRDPHGNRKITEAVAGLFGEPADSDELCYLSQLVQALALQTAVEHWRRNKPRCMGALYWQLNDCWAAPSWASIDCELRYRAAQYVARRFYAPLLGSLAVNGDALEVWASSDVPAEVGGRYVVEAWSLASKLQRRVEGLFRLPSQASRCLAVLPTGELFGSTIPNEERLVRLILNAGGQRHESVQVFAPYKELSLRRPTIDATVTSDGSGLQVLLGTDAPALFVELSCDPIPGVFSDNLLALFPGHAARIRFSPADQARAANLRTNLRIRSLGGS
jgi:beta-mannosidase